MYNAGKYFTGILAVLAHVWVTKFEFDAVFFVWLAVKFVSTVYSLVWDFRMDWGILRTKQRGRYGLRDKLTYPIWFYYWAAMTNFLLRFVWLLFLWKHWFQI